MNSITDLIAQRKCNKVEKDYHTARKWAEIWGFSQSHTRATINKAIGLKIMQKKNFRIISGGMSVRIPHYKQIA